MAGVRELRGLGAGEARCLKVPQERGSLRGWSPSTCRMLPLTDQDDLQTKLRNVQARLNLGLLLTQSSYVTYSPRTKVVGLCSSALSEEAAHPGSEPKRRSKLAKESGYETALGKQGGSVGVYCVTTHETIWQNTHERD